jgi:hypothetical protein
VLIFLTVPLRSYIVISLHSTDMKPPHQVRQPRAFPHMPVDRLGQMGVVDVYT